MDELTHKIEITVTGNYTHGGKHHSSVAVSGDGGIEHMLSAFKAAMIAAGYEPITADNYIGARDSDG